MRFGLDDEVMRLFPDYRLGLVILRGADNTTSKAAEILALLREVEASVREQFTPETIVEHPHLKAWKERFAAFGMGKKYLNSALALATRVVEGYQLPDINPLVNLYNAVSLKYLIPFGGENLACTQGAMQLAVAKGGESFWSIGAEKDKPAIQGEIVWRDSLGVTCRAWNWRQCERTKIDAIARDTYHIIDLIPPYGETELKAAAEEFARLSEDLLGARTEIYYLNADNPSVEIAYEQHYQETIIAAAETVADRDTKAEPPTTSLELHDAFPTQISALDDHVSGTPTRHHVLYQGSVGAEIKAAIVSALQTLWQEKGFVPGDFPQVELEHPADMTHGDYATNVAMKLAKVMRQAPIVIAQDLAVRLESALDKSLIQTITAVNPGFINFTLSPQALVREMQRVLEQKEHFGEVSIRRGKTVMIEHTQPNSHKEVHIGHVRNSVLGMAEVRLHWALGYHVISATYGGDVGPHVAKCLWGLRGVDLHAISSLSDKVHAIQAAYIRGTQAEETDEQVKLEVKQINKAIYERSDPELTALWQRSRDWSIEKHKEVYARIGTEFDRYYWESEVWEKGLEEVRAHIGDIFTESEGAVIFDAEPYGLHRRVFITGQGTATYEAKEIGLERLKMDEYPLDYGVIQTGTDHIDYFKVVLKAVELIYPEMAGRFDAEHFGMVNIPSGKMSSREGNVVLAEDVLDDMLKRALAEVDKRYTEMPAEEKRHLANIISLGATKYALLKYDPGQDMTFDPDTTLSFSGDSGPYLQYVCVRISSIIAKAHEAGIDFDSAEISLDGWANGLQIQEQILLRKLYQLPEIVIRSALEYKPNYLCAYLFEVAQSFNDFYLACPVIKAEPSVARARLALIGATSRVLTNGLALLGIDVPEKM